MTKLNSDIDLKLSDTVVQQLQRRNIKTVLEFLEEDSNNLATFSGLSLKDIVHIQKIISLKYGGVVRNASDLFKIELSNIIPTDLPCLDNLLKGGLYPGQMYELCGLPSSGKTQLCLTIASNIALRANSLVRYIDTKRDFHGSRVEQILLNKNICKKVTDEVLNRIRVCSVQKLYDLFEILRWLTSALKVEKEECRTRIIIIDSLPAIIFSVSDDNKVAVTLNHLANICYFIANEFRLSIITVNLITQWDSGNETESACINTNNVIDSDVIPTLGKYWEGIPNTRLLIEKLDLGNRKISIWKSVQLETCRLSIDNNGIICTS
ncbi:rad51 recombinase D [Megalopta genalis]|uniref:rad51 recombinase D n=1 Tax=Megalopta genalis TaxID=115081 RepID=UPI003FD11EEF